MKKILYLPLDERPCNHTFVKFLMEDNPEVQLVTPSLAELGDKKKPAEYQRVADYLLRECVDADYLILAIKCFKVAKRKKSPFENIRIFFGDAVSVLFYG